MSRHRDSSGRRQKPLPSAAAVSAGARSRVDWRLAVIVLVGVLTYVNGVRNPFVFDDQSTVVENQQIRHLTDMSSVLFPERELPVAGRPVANLTFAINYAIGELDVVGYRLGNILIHVACALALFGVVRRALELPRIDAALRAQSVGLAFAVALLWVVHPLNSEVVNYVTQRTESLMALSYLVTLYASIRGLDGGSGRWWQGVAVLACTVGMGCKESMVTAPLMVVLFDRVFVFDTFGEAVRRRGRFYLWLMLTWVVLAALMWSGPRRRSAGFSAGVSVWTYLLNQTPMISRYLRLAAWPSGLVGNYGWPRALAVSDVWAYSALIVALGSLVAWAWRKAPQLGFLGAWFFITLAPTSSIVPIATEVGAERRMYLPLAGLLVLTVVGLTLAWARWAPQDWREAAKGRLGATLALFALTAISALYVAGAVGRTREYSSGLLLAERTLERYPTPVAHHVLGEQLIQDGRRELGLSHLRQALPGAPRAHLTLGLELFKDGKLDEAIVELHAFVEAQPALLHVIQAHEFLGRAYAQQERWPEAVREFEAMLQLSPWNPTAEYMLGEVYFSQQKFRDAIAHFRNHLNVRPNTVEALSQLGIALGSTGEVNEALAVLGRAEILEPNHGAVQRNLATALFMKGDLEAALAHARRAVALQADDAGSHFLLGLTLQQQGQREEAARAFRRAVDLDPTIAEAFREVEPRRAGGSGSRAGR